MVKKEDIKRGKGQPKVMERACPHGGKRMEMRQKRRIVSAVDSVGDDPEEDPAEETAEASCEAVSGFAGEGSSQVSRRLQKKRFQRRAAEEERKKEAEKGIGEVLGKVKAAGEQGAKAAVRSAAGHPGTVLLSGGAGLLLLFVVTVFSSCSLAAGGVGGGLTGASFTAETEEILGVEEAYLVLEEELEKRIEGIKEEYPGYDEYRIESEETGHNPFSLAAYLTVKYEDFTVENAGQELEKLFAEQYRLMVSESVEIRMKEEEREREVTWTDKEGKTQKKQETYTETVPFEYRILTASLTNRGLEAAVEELGLTREEEDRYQLLLTTGGNRGDLFAGNPYAYSGEGLEYDIPGEALSDVKFARMVQEGTKYLGKPYVWGGDSPATGFDCSGFVSWVVNHSGNGWSFGRLTAEDLRGVCRIIPKTAAKPGDLIFFKGTYATGGASHVGIYVGDGTMLHCGNPVQFASCETEYWKRHFYCFGRLP